MGIELPKDTVSNPIKENVFESIKDSADRAAVEVQKKQERHSLALKNLNIFQNKKYFALAKLNNSNPKDKKVQAEYKLLDEQEFSYELESDISLFSLQNSLSHSSKMNQSLFMANSLLT